MSSAAIVSGEHTRIIGCEAVFTTTTFTGKGISLKKQFGAYEMDNFLFTIAQLKPFFNLGLDYQSITVMKPLSIVFHYGNRACHLC